MKKLLVLVIVFIATGCDQSSSVQCPCIVTGIKKDKDDYTIRAEGRSLEKFSLPFFDFHTKFPHNLGDTIK